MKDLLGKIRLIESLDLNTVDSSAAWKEMIAQAYEAGFSDRDFIEKLNTSPSVLFTWKATEFTPRPERREEIRTALVGELNKRLVTNHRPFGPPVLSIVR